MFLNEGIKDNSPSREYQIVLKNMQQPIHIFISDNYSDFLFEKHKLEGILCI